MGGMGRQKGVDLLGDASISILSRDPNPSGKPPETQKKGRFLKRTMVEKNRESTLRDLPIVWSCGEKASSPTCRSFS